MDINNFNKKLVWLDRAEILKFDTDFNLTLKITAEGGPGENVELQVTFKSVSFMAIPTIINFSEHPRIEICDINQARKLLPPAELNNEFISETKENNLTTYKFLDNTKELNYTVVSYGAIFSQDPTNWNVS